jgi:hypothetical protein
MYFWWRMTLSLWTGESEGVATLLGKLAVSIAVPLISSIGTAIWIPFGAVGLVLLVYSMAINVTAAGRRMFALTSSWILRWRGHEIEQPEDRSGFGKWKFPSLYLSSFQLGHPWLRVIAKMSEWFRF